MVRALLAASDPQTGQPLSDAEICNELVLFMLAGHDTTSTTLSYALWALGHHRDLQDQVAAEVGELGDRTLTRRTFRGWATPSRCCTKRYGCAHRVHDRSAGDAGH